MKRVQRDMLIDILIWIVIITQVILSSCLVFALSQIKNLGQIAAQSNQGADIIVKPTRECSILRAEYEEFMREVWSRAEEQVSLKIVSVEEVPLEGRDLYVSYIYEICQRYNNVDPDIFVCLVENESHYDPNARNYNGTCVGLSQLSVKWHAKRAASLGVEDLCDPYGNLLTGIDYFSDLMETAKGDPELALMLYHMRADDAWALYKSGQGDPYARYILEMAKEV